MTRDRRKRPPDADGRSGILANARAALRERGAIALLRRIGASLIRPLLELEPVRRLSLALSSRRLSGWQAREAGLEDVLDTAFSYRGVPPYRSIRPSQVRSELKQLAERVRAREPRSLIEIGTKQGGTLYVWARAFDELEHAISIDLPGGEFGGGYKRWEADLYRRFDEEVEMDFLRTDSHSDACENRVQELLAGRPVDFLFIDGDHSYEGVREDFLRYRAYVADGGVIALHDIVEHPPETGCEVRRFWQELTDGPHATEEIVRDPDQEWAGIGVVYV